MATFDEKKFIDLEGLKAYHGKIKETLDKKVEYVTESSRSEDLPFATFSAATLNGTIVKVDTVVVDTAAPGGWDTLDSYDGQYGVKYSTDNTNWTVLRDKFFVKVAAGKKIFLAVDNSGSTYLQRSFDGINWERLDYNYGLRGMPSVLYFDFVDGYFYLGMDCGSYGVIVDRFEESYIETASTSGYVNPDRVVGIDWSSPVVAPQAMTIKNNTVILTSTTGEIYSQTLPHLLNTSANVSDFTVANIPSDVIPADFDPDNDNILYKEPRFFDNKFFIVGKVFKATNWGNIDNVVSEYGRTFVLESSDGVNWDYNTALTELGVPDIVKFDNKYYIATPLWDGSVYNPIKPGLYNIGVIGPTAQDVINSMMEINVSTYDLWGWYAAYGFIEMGSNGLVHTAVCMSSSSGIPASNIIGLEAKLDSSINLVTEPDILTLF